MWQLQSYEFDYRYNTVISNDAISTLTFTMVASEVRPNEVPFQKSRAFEIGNNDKVNNKNNRCRYLINNIKMHSGNYAI